VHPRNGANSFGGEPVSTPIKPARRRNALRSLR
jgi:hypothetical protein